VRVTRDSGISRDELKAKLMDKGIMTDIYYALPIYKQPFYRELGYNDDLPNTEQAADQVLSLPVHPSLTREDLEYIVESLIECLKES
jgi:perosamine synthetase